MSEAHQQFAQAWIRELCIMLAPWFEKRLAEGVAYIGRALPIGVGTVDKKGHKLGHAIGKQVIEINSTVHDGFAVAEVVVHELVHCHVPHTDTEGKVLPAHGRAFGDLATRMGLLPQGGKDGKSFTATYAGPELRQHLLALVKHLGTYPKVPVTPTPPRPRGPSQLRWVAHCEGCHNKVTMRAKTRERGVTVTCDNEECEYMGLEMEQEEEIPAEKRPRKPSPFVS